MVDTFANFTRNSSNEYSVPWSQVWPDSRLSDIDKTGAQPGPGTTITAKYHLLPDDVFTKSQFLCVLWPGSWGILILCTGWMCSGDRQYSGHYVCTTHNYTQSWKYSRSFSLYWHSAKIEHIHMSWRAKISKVFLKWKHWIMSHPHPWQHTMYHVVDTTAAIPSSPLASWADV